MSEVYAKAGVQISEFTHRAFFIEPSFSLGARLVDTRYLPCNRSEMDNVPQKRVSLSLHRIWLFTSPPVLFAHDG